MTKRLVAVIARALRFCVHVDFIAVNMSKSSGGGGFKGGDKASKGGCKVVAKQNGLENALENVPDAFLCPGGHKMKLHRGSRREGQLTCDGPDDICCGKDGDGILHVGDERYTCEACDFDICPSCFDTETEEEKTPEEKREEARQRLRAKTGRGSVLTSSPKDVKTASLSTKSAEEQAKVDKEALRARIAANVAAAKAAQEAAEKAPADAALKSAIEANTLEGLKSALAEHAEAASAEIVAEARKVRDKLKDKEKKAAQKARKNGGEEAAKEEEEPVVEEAAAKSPEKATVSFAAPVTPEKPKATGGFAFDFSKMAAPAVNDGSDSDENDDDDEEEEEEEEEVPPPQGGEEVEISFPLKAPENPLVCPFTGAVMKEPVILADGHTYEKVVVEKYLEDHDESPRTGEKLKHKSILPNLMAEELCKLALSF